MKTQNILATEFSMETNIITIDFIPTIEEQNILFANNDSIVLEF